MSSPKINYQAMNDEADKSGTYYQDFVVEVFYSGFEDDYTPTWDRFKPRNHQPKKRIPTWYAKYPIGDNGLPIVKTV